MPARRRSTPLSLAQIDALLADIDADASSRGLLEDAAFDDEVAEENARLEVERRRLDAVTCDTEADPSQPGVGAPSPPGNPSTHLVPPAGMAWSLGSRLGTTRPRDDEALDAHPYPTGPSFNHRITAATSSASSQALPGARDHLDADTHARSSEYSTRWPSERRSSQQRRPGPPSVTAAGQRPSGLPEIVVPSGYVRDRAGRWRYELSGELVPGARDVTLGRLWRFVRDESDGRRVVLVPRELCRRPELDWVRDASVGECGARRGPFLNSGPYAACLEVPVEVWDAHADWPLGIDAHELLTQRMLTVDTLAQWLMIRPATVRSYVTRGYLPSATVTVGATPLWSAPVVALHLSRRAGQGRRGGAGVGQGRKSRG